MRYAVALALALVASTSPSVCLAYTIRSGFSESCHERLTVDAFAEVLPEWEDLVSEVPDGIWSRLALELRPLLGERAPDLIERFDAEPLTRFVLLSLVLGVREVDTAGHSLANLNALRRIHGSPDAAGQYAHALRALGDDGLAGDLSAIAGTRAVIREKVEGFARAVQRPGTHISRAPVFVDHYGRIDVEVIEPLFVLGEAMHALQDSHSHTIRDAEGNEILHVLNYVEAIGGDLEPSRDGWPHSDALDDCNGPVGLLIRRATERTVALARAAFALSRGDDGPLERGLTACPEGEIDRADCGWVEYRASCERALLDDDADAIEDACCTERNRFCDSPWTDVARRDQTGSYVAAALGCSVGPRATPRTRTAAAQMACFLACALGLARLHRRMRRRTTVVVLALLFAAHAKLPRAHAASDPSEHAREAFGALELHGSLLSDKPDDSVIKPAAGVALRGGYRWGRWGGFGYLERNYWQAVELALRDADVRSAPGVYAFAIGVEHIFAKGQLRSSLALGLSVLAFDAIFDEAGSIGFFADLRPLGIRFPLGRHLHLVFDPLTATRHQPVMRSPSISLLQFRTVIGLEGHL